LIEGFRTSC